MRSAFSVQDTKRFHLVILAATSFLCAIAQADEAARFDQYGGLLSRKFEATGFFRTHHDGERWWLVTPEGHAFLSMGACVVRPDGDTEIGTGRKVYGENVLKRYGDVAGWEAETLRRFEAWGWNTLGNWSCAELREELPYTTELGVSGGGWGKDQVPDFFDPAVQQGIRERGERAAEFADDPNLVGYFLDNELPWSTDWRFYPDLFPGTMKMPADAPGKQALVACLRERHGEFASFARAWDTASASWDDLLDEQRIQPRDWPVAIADMEAFVYLAAREYFRNAVEGIRSKDKNHLILGCRFVWVLAPRPIVRACGEFCDVVSVNYYEPGPIGKLVLPITGGTSLRIKSETDLAEFHALTGKPLMVTEFSFRARQSNNPNSYPPGVVLQPTVATQADRADKFEEYVTAWMRQPFFVGYHWFQWMDEPRAGRAHDGENGNYGVVTIDDEPWETLVERITSVNRGIWDLRAGE